MHTPGPWTWRKFGSSPCLATERGGALIVLDAMGEKQEDGPPAPGILRMRDQEHCLMVEIDPEHPDARLIKAAPDLLEALQGLGVLPTEGYCFCPRGYTGGRHVGECIDANKAIDKATGPTQ